MAQGRSYNPLLKSYPFSEKVNAVSIGAETLYTRLIAQSDDAGRYWGEPLMILGQLYTHRMASLQVNEDMIRTWLDELASQQLIETYQVGGRTYLQLLNLHRPTRKDREPHYIFPVNQLATNGKPLVCPIPSCNPSCNPTPPTPPRGAGGGGVSNCQPESVPPSAADAKTSRGPAHSGAENPIVPMLTAAGVSPRKASAIASANGVPSAAIVAHWAAVRSEPSVRNTAGVLTHRLADRTPPPPLDGRAVHAAVVAGIVRRIKPPGSGWIDVSSGKPGYNATGFILDGKLAVPSEKLAEAEYGA